MEYIEHLWRTGEGRGLAADTLASLQDFDAKIRGQLPGAWRLAPSEDVGHSRIAQSGAAHARAALGMPKFSLD